MKKIVLILAAAVSALLFVACSGSSNGPEAAAKKAITALQKGDFSAYAATFNMSEDDQKQLAAFAEEKLKEAYAENGGIKSFNITDSSIDGDNATVTAHLVYKNGSEEDQKLYFTKVDDVWKQEMKK